jgi:peptidoglycan LD-endopeptidase CwlK
MPTKESQLAPELLSIFLTSKEIIPGLICTCSHRGKVEQDAAYASGKSKLKYPDSKHNVLPSRAMDLAIARKGVINWGDRFDWGLIAGVVLAVAKAKGIKIRLGADWDGDLDLTDQTFNDMCHYEMEG